MSDILLGTPSHGHTSTGRPAKTSVHNLNAKLDTVKRTYQERWPTVTDDKR